MYAHHSKERPTTSTGITASVKREKNSVFERQRFDTPKPTRIIEENHQLAIDKDGVVLDFCRFRHHGYAVMALNNEEEDEGAARLFYWPLSIRH